MACKGVCIRYKAKKPVEGGRYQNGQRRCQICELFMSWEGLWCPCCGYRLRTKPRNSKYKAKLRSRIPHWGMAWKTFQEKEVDGSIMMVPDDEQVILVSLKDDSRNDYHLWKCMAGKKEVERFIKA